MTNVSQLHPVVLVSFDDEYAARFVRDLESLCPTVHVSPLLRALDASIGSLQPSIIVFDLQTIKTEDRSIFDIMTTINDAFPRARKVALGHQNMTTQVISAMKAGACDFLEREASAEEMRETIGWQLGQVRDGPGGRAGRVIAIMSGRENEGETELAANLAAQIAVTRGASEVLLLDLTLEESQLEIEFNVEVTYSVRDAIEELLRLDKPVLMEVLAKHKSGLCLMPLTTRSSKDGEISAQQLATLLGALRNFFPVIVINGGCLRDKYCQQYLLPLCDRVLLVCPQTLGSLRAAREIVPAGETSEEQRAKFGLIVSKYDADIELRPSQMASRIGIPLVGTLPAAWLQIANSHNLGSPLVLSGSNCRYARAIRGLADELQSELATGDAAAKTAANVVLFGWWRNLMRAAL